jgi:hypothetical protein
MVTADAFAQRSEESITKALKHYKENLTHENVGVVKSSIQNIMRLKVAYPEMDYSKVSKKLEVLSFEADSKLIRDMAYVAADLIKHPDQFQWDLPESYDELKDFFYKYEVRFDERIAQLD